MGNFLLILVLERKHPTVVHILPLRWFSIWNWYKILKVQIAHSIIKYVIRIHCISSNDSETVYINLSDFSNWLFLFNQNLSSSVDFPQTVYFAISCCIADNLQHMSLMFQWINGIDIWNIYKTTVTVGNVTAFKNSFSFVELYILAIVTIGKIVASNILTKKNPFHW